jgi:NAD(P)-dependent dehydrogenase (short-subunit alcohol dehydrogenase family)
LRAPFAAQGAKVFVCDIDPEALETLAREVPGVTTVVCDVSKRQDNEHVEAALDALGGLDVLVNNAGISGSTAPVEKSDPDDWEKVVQVNLIGTFNVTRLAIPHLKNPRQG